MVFYSFNQVSGSMSTNPPDVENLEKSKKIRIITNYAKQNISRKFSAKQDKEFLKDLVVI